LHLSSRFGEKQKTSGGSFPFPLRKEMRENEGLSQLGTNNQNLKNQGNTTIRAISQLTFARQRGKPSGRRKLEIKKGGGPGEDEHC